MFRSLFSLSLIDVFRIFPSFCFISYIIESRDTYSEVLRNRKHICPRSMKRDCPSLIFAKTQFFFHLCFFFFRHVGKVVSYRHFPYLGFSSAIFRNMPHFSAVVAFRRWPCSWGAIYIHCVFVLDFDRDGFLFGLAWPSLCVRPSYFKLPFSIVFFSLAELFFYFRGTRVPCLELSVNASVTGVSYFD